MNIIVEGCDGVGKDTFINNLSELTGRKVLRGSSFEISKHGGDTMFELSKNMLLNNDDAIINRFFYSNLVYGPLYGYPMMTEEQYQELNELVSERATVYYLQAETDTIVERIKKRGDDDIKPEDISMIQQAYEDMWELYKPATLVRINTDTDELLDINSGIYHSVVMNDFEMDYIDKGFSKN